MISLNPDIVRFIINTPSYAELVSTISDLEPAQQACLVALKWLAFRKDLCCTYISKPRNPILAEPMFSGQRALS